MLSILKCPAPLKCFPLDGTGERRDGGKEICTIYCEEHESWGMMKPFAKSRWLRNIDSGEDLYDLPSLGAQEKLSNPRRSPARSVDDKLSSNVAINVGESRVDATPNDDDECGILKLLLSPSK